MESLHYRAEAWQLQVQVQLVRQAMMLYYMHSAQRDVQSPA